MTDFIQSRATSEVKSGQRLVLLQALGNTACPTVSKLVCCGETEKRAHHDVKKHQEVLKASKMDVTKKACPNLYAGQKVKQNAQKGLFCIVLHCWMCLHFFEFGINLVPIRPLKILVRPKIQNVFFWMAFECPKIEAFISTGPSVHSDPSSAHLQG